MAKAMFLAWTNPVDEASESDFNAWYEDTHIPQVRAAIPAVTAVHRYQIVNVPGATASSSHRYLAVYELDTDDVAGAMAALGAATSGGRLDPTDALDSKINPPVVQWFEGVTG